MCSGLRGVGAFWWHGANGVHTAMLIAIGTSDELASVRQYHVVRIFCSPPHEKWRAIGSYCDNAKVRSERRDEALDRKAG